MAFEVGIKITAESQIEAVKAAEAAVQNLGKSAAAAAPATANLGKSAAATAPALASLGLQARQVSPLLGVAATQLTAASGAAGVLARGITTLLFTGFTPLGFAIAGATIAAGAAIEIFGRWREEIERQEAIIKRWSDGQQAGVRVMTDLQGEVDILGAKLTRDPLIIALVEQRVATEALKSKLREAGIEGNQAAKILALFGKALDLKGANAQLDEFNKKLKAVGERGGAGGILLSKEVDAIRTQAGEMFKGGIVDEATVQRMNTFLHVIKDVAKQKFGFDIPPDLQTKLADTEQKLQAVAKEHNIQLKVDLLDAGSKFQEIETQLRKIGEGANVKFKVDSSGFKQAEDQYGALKAKLESAPIIIGTILKTTGSPTLPFSEYFGRYAPDLLKKFAGSVPALNFGTDFSGIIGDLLLRNVEIARAQAALRTGPHIGLALGFGESLGAQQRAIMESLAFLMRLSGPAAPAGGGGGGGTVNNITINISGSEPDWLPELERVLRRVTGSRGGIAFTVQN